MFCDIFSEKEAKRLLSGKKIYFFGSSNMRCLYKDLLWLLKNGTLCSQDSFRAKNESSYLEDERISNGTLHNGVNYTETRVYEKGPYLFYHFLTRLLLDDFVKIIEKMSKKKHPDVIFINSTLWDLSRWGSITDCIQNFKMNLTKTFRLLKTTFPTTRIIWKTCLPVSPQASGAIFTDEVRSIVPMLPWHVLEANNYAAITAKFFEIDVLDFHNYLNMRGFLRVKDGIHWDTVAIRYMTNIFLTHLALCWNVKLPGVIKLNEIFVAETNMKKLSAVELKERFDKKKSYFDKIKNKVKKSVVRNINKFVNPIIKAKNAIRNKRNYIAEKVKKTIDSQIRKRYNQQENKENIYDYRYYKNNHNQFDFASDRYHDPHGYYPYNHCGSYDQYFSNNYVYSNYTDSNSRNYRRDHYRDAFKNVSHFRNGYDNLKHHKNSHKRY